MTRYEPFAGGWRERFTVWWHELVDPDQPTAAEVFVGIWRKVRSRRSTRHPFHREVLAELEALVNEVVDVAPDTSIDVRGQLVEWGVLRQRYPRLARRLTREWMLGFVTAEVDRVAAVADSTDYLVARTMAHGRQALTVQHRLSGLRALFVWVDGQHTGMIVAKSYSITSIDPARAWPHEGLEAVDQWEGLGITGRIYQYAAELLPDLRWSATTLTPQSTALRRRLHVLDPWRFAPGTTYDSLQACRWCHEHGGWAGLTRPEFAAHPLPNHE